MAVRCQRSKYLRWGAVVDPVQRHRRGRWLRKGGQLARSYVEAAPVDDCLIGSLFDVQRVAAERDTRLAGRDLAALRVGMRGGNRADEQRAQQQPRKP